MWSEYVHLLHDPAHIAFELTLMFIIDLSLVPFIKRAVRKHDKEKHSEATYR